ncbi:helix-turn-helix domain-containing protein [Streptomyces hydrogenans]
MTQMVMEMSGTARDPVMLTLIPMTEQPRGRRAIEIGPTGQAVAGNLARLRERRGLTTRQLSALLERAGRPIPASGITRMEKGERVANVDDVAALAVVLGVSPSALMLPLGDAPEELIEVTGGGTVPANVAWDWVDGRRPLHWPAGDTSTADLEYRLYSRPPGRREVFGVVLRPRGVRGEEQIAKIREAYKALAATGLDIDELQRLDPEAFKQQMGESGGSSG